MEHGVDRDCGGSVYWRDTGLCALRLVQAIPNRGHSSERGHAMYLGVGDVGFFPG